MDKITEYCYNLMEAAIKSGAEGSGLTKETCTAYMNMMFGVRGYEQYVKETEEKESEVDETWEQDGESAEASCLGMPLPE